MIQSRQVLLRCVRRLQVPVHSLGTPPARILHPRAGIVRPRPVSSLPFTRPSSRAYSSPTSNEFWRDLNLAVKQGNGEQAEEIVSALLKKNSEDASSSVRLDTRIFSLVLEAWKNSESTIAPQRAQQLLDQMVALAEQRILTELPSIDDYHAVLECWAACPSKDASLQAAESALKTTQRLMKDHAPTEQTFLLVLQILSNGGHAPSARDFVKTLPKGIPATVEMYNLVLSAFVRSTLPDAASQAQALLEEMQAPETDLPRPNGESHDLIIQCWAQHPQSSQDPSAGQYAQHLLSQMKSRKIQTTLASYHNVISILASQGEAEQAERVLNSLVKAYGAQYDAQLKPTLAPFETVLLAYSKSFHVDAAPRAESVLTHMRELYNTGWVERPPDVFSYNFVLKCWMHSKHKKAVQRALDLLEKMRSDGVNPDTSTMNTILNVLAQQNDPLQAEQFLWEFYQSYLQDPIQNPQPDVISFGTVLKAWSLSDDPQASERAESLLLKLQALYESGWDRCQPDHAIYSNVMKCYVTSKIPDAPHKAEAVLRSMQQAAKDLKNPSLMPDTVCWNMAINAWGQAGQGPRAEALFKEMLQGYLDNPETDASPNNITFSAVLSAWAKTKGNPQAPDRAEALLQQMRHLAESDSFPDVKPNVVSYSIVLDCLAYAKTTAAAIRADSILREMQASDDPTVQPNVISFNSTIKAWSLSRDPNALFKVTALLKEMLNEFENHGKKQMAPNANTFGSVLKVIADSNVPDKGQRAQAIANLMEKFHVPWNEWSQNQWKRCHSSRDSKSSGQRRRGGTTKKVGDLPDLPGLKYS